MLGAGSVRKQSPRSFQGGVCGPQDTDCLSEPSFYWHALGELNLSSQSLRMRARIMWRVAEQRHKGSVHKVVLMQAGRQRGKDALGRWNFWEVMVPPWKLQEAHQA